MRGEITTPCKKGSSRYTSLNLLGWALNCPYAIELLMHGSTPLEIPVYPTAEESGKPHKDLVEAIKDNEKDIFPSWAKIIYSEEEYQHEIQIAKGDSSLCARSKADLVYVVATGKGPMVIYIEVASSRIDSTKPLQALLRGIALYYEYKIPVGVVIVSPGEIRFKLVTDKDQKEIMGRINRDPTGYQVKKELCSLCSLSRYCPYREA